MHPLDINFIAVAWIAGSVLMLPLLALTARFGFVPLVESIADARAAGKAPYFSAADERRIAGIERRLAALAAAVERESAFRAAAQPLGRSPHAAGATGGRPAH
jgi:hypothetical protein